MHVQKRVSSVLTGIALLAVLLLLAIWLLKRFLLTPPAGLEAMQPVNLDDFAGPWHEIARLDNAVEADMNPVHLAFRPGLPQEGGRAYEISLVGHLEGGDERRWRQTAIWTAEKVQASQGSLQIPCGFAGLNCGLHIIAIAAKTRHWLMLTGPTRQFLWIIAREPAMSESELLAVLEQAKEMGFDTRDVVLGKNKMPSLPTLPALPYETPISKMPPPPNLSGQGADEPLNMPSEPPPMPIVPPPMPAGPPPMPAGPPPMPAEPPPMP